MNQSERRHDDRIRPAERLTTTVGSRILARLVDFSLGGLQIEAEVPFEEAHRCQITLPRELGYLRLAARVLRCLDGDSGDPSVPAGRFHVGLEFTDVDPAGREDLEEAIADFRIRQRELSDTATRLKVTVERKPPT